MTHDDDNIVRLEDSEWYSARELADRLDVSVRTIYRRLERGQIDKRETPRGTVYRVRDSSRADSKNVTKGDSSSDSPFGEAMLKLLDRERQQSDRVAELTGRVSELEARLEAALEDRERLLRYVQESDARNEELIDELESVEAQLMQARARVYLETGRREMAEERLDDARDEVARLEGRARELAEELDQATSKDRGWRPFG